MTRRFMVLVFAMLVMAVAQLSMPQPAGQRGLKVLLLYDMEGVTGASKPRMSAPAPRAIRRHANR